MREWLRRVREWLRRVREWLRRVREWLRKVREWSRKALEWFRKALEWFRGAQKWLCGALKGVRRVLECRGTRLSDRERLEDLSRTTPKLQRATTERSARFAQIRGCSREFMLHFSFWPARQPVAGTTWRKADTRMLAKQRAGSTVRAPRSLDLPGAGLYRFSNAVCADSICVRTDAGPVPPSRSRCSTLRYAESDSKTS